MLSDNTYTATIGANGRVVIPAELRREFGWDEGQKITFSSDGKRLIISSLDELLARIRSKIDSSQFSQGNLPSDILIRERREEAAHEDTKFMGRISTD